MSKPAFAKPRAWRGTQDDLVTSRNRQIGAIHAACRRLGLDEDARRDVQLGLIGKASLTDMTMGELGQVLDSLNRGRKGPSGHRAHAGKIRALWWSLYWIGVEVEPNDHALDGFVRRQTGISALRFLDHHKAPAVIEALKSWLAREGVAWAKVPGDLGDRRAVADAIWRKLQAAEQPIQTTLASFAAATFNVPSADNAWSAQEWDAVIRFLGKRLRRGAAK